jgi:hypothetical protein
VELARYWYRRSGGQLFQDVDIEQFGSSTTDATDADRDVLETLEAEPIGPDSDPWQGVECRGMTAARDDIFAKLFTAWFGGLDRHFLGYETEAREMLEQWGTGDSSPTDNVVEWLADRMETWRYSGAKTTDKVELCLAQDGGTDG